MFVGYDHNQIIYDYATSQWEITKLSVTGNFTRAVTKASLASMAIGTNVWTVFNDSKRSANWQIIGWKLKRDTPVQTVELETAEEIMLLLTIFFFTNQKSNQVFKRESV